MPSHAKFNKSKQSIENAEILSKINGVEVIVTDNSRDEKKAAYWNGKSNNTFKYLISNFYSSSENGEFAIRQTQGEYLCFMSDDDQLISLPGFDPKDMISEAGAVGFRPAMALYTERTGIYAINNFSITDSKPADRITSYFKKNGGANTTLFSCFRRSIIAELMLEVMPLHPTRGGYNDWAIVLALLSSGSLSYYPNLLYIYHNQNWSISSDIIQNTQKTFTDCGLPADNDQILQVLLALDSLVLVSRKGSAINEVEKYEAAHLAFDTYYKSFCSNVLSAGSENIFRQDRLSLCRKIIGEAVDMKQRVAAALQIVETWNPGLRDKYLYFIDRTVDFGIRSKIL